MDNNLQEFTDALKKIGFNYFNDIAKIEAMDKKDRELIWNSYKSIVEYFKRGGDVDGISPKKLGIHGNVNAISQIIAKYTTDDSAAQHFNAEGEATANYIDNNYPSIILQDLRNLDYVVYCELEKVLNERKGK